MPKITKRESKDTVVVKTQEDKKKANDKTWKWWEASTKKEMASQVLDTASFLKTQQQYRYRQANIYSRLYGNQPLFNFAGSSLNRMSTTNNLPIDRPTMNVIQSCVDTLVSRLTQSKPRPVFLTDGGDYRLRNMAEKANGFIMGEFFRTKAYTLGERMLKDGAILGTGCIKVLKGPSGLVELERRLFTELLVDVNDAMYGDPRSLYEFKLIDRSVLAELFPKSRSDIAKAQQGFPDDGGDSEKTASDQIIVVEAWHLPSSKEAKDGLHVIVCSEGLIFDEQWKHNKFPFAFMPYSERMLGFWGQGLAEQLMGTQVEINKLLMTITSSINLVGVPRVFVEDGSKIVKAHLNNNIGSIVTYRGTKPSYEIAPCVPQELYAQLQRLVDYAYQQSGISALAATSQKPAGLNSGEAIRNYDDLQSDRFASLSKRYHDFYIDLAYLMIEQAQEIAEETGEYSTVYPDKNHTMQIDLPRAALLKDPIIQCFDSSSLPRDPSGRLQRVTEMMQSGLIDPAEGRRLLSFPDIEQQDRLLKAGEERILKILDDIIEKGKYTPPDPFMDLELATKIVVQYYNLYSESKLEEARCQMLRDFFTQIQALKTEAMTPPPGMAIGQGISAPQANPEALPTNPMIPNVPQGQ